MFDLDSCQYKLPLFDAPFPSFILRGAGYQSVYYGINKTRPILSESRRIEISNILKFGVYQVDIERGTAIQKTPK